MNENLIQKFKTEGVTVKYFDDTNIPKIKIIDGKWYKAIEQDKSSVSKSGLIFLEPLLMIYAAKKGLSSPKVLAIAEDNEKALFVTEEIKGINGKALLMSNPNYQARLENEAENLRKQYEDAGIVRQMKLKDLVFQIENGQIIGAIPTDFERVKYNSKMDWNEIKEIISDWHMLSFSESVPDWVQAKLK